MYTLNIRILTMHVKCDKGNITILTTVVLERTCCFRYWLYMKCEPSVSIAFIIVWDGILWLWNWKFVMVTIILFSVAKDAGAAWRCPLFQNLYIWTSNGANDTAVYTVLQKLKCCRYFVIHINNIKFPLWGCSLTNKRLLKLWLRL